VKGSRVHSCVAVLAEPARPSAAQGGQLRGAEREASGQHAGGVEGCTGREGNTMHARGGGRPVTAFPSSLPDGLALPVLGFILLASLVWQPLAPDVLQGTVRVPTHAPTTPMAVQEDLHRGSQSQQTGGCLLLPCMCQQLKTPRPTPNSFSRFPSCNCQSRCQAAHLDGEQDVGRRALALDLDAVCDGRSGGEGPAGAAVPALHGSWRSWSQGPGIHLHVHALLQSQEPAMRSSTSGTRTGGCADFCLP